MVHTVDARDSWSFSNMSSHSTNLRVNLLECDIDNCCCLVVSCCLLALAYWSGEALIANTAVATRTDQSAARVILCILKAT